MKRSLPLAAILAAPVAAQAEVIAFWDFNDGFDSPLTNPQIIHTATSGAGTLYQQRADIDGNGKGGTAFIDAPNSINSAAGRSIAWDDSGRSGDNDAEIFVTIDSTNFIDLFISFDIQGEAPNLATALDIKYDTSPLEDVINPGDVTGTIKDFDSGTSFDGPQNAPIIVTEAFTRLTFDLSSIDALEAQPILALRIDDFDDGNDQLRIDNFLITGTLVPEPSSAILALAGLTILARRRRS